MLWRSLTSPSVFVLALAGPKAASASLGSLEPDPKHPKLSGKKFLVDFDNGVWSRSLVMIALEPSHGDSVRAVIWP